VLKLLGPIFDNKWFLCYNVFSFNKTELKMTQTEFYAKYPVLPDSKEQRLVLDLRDCEFSWDKIDLVFLHLTITPYESNWNIELLETI